MSQVYVWRSEDNLSCLALHLVWGRQDLLLTGACACLAGPWVLELLFSQNLTYPRCPGLQMHMTTSCFIRLLRIQTLILISTHRVLYLLSHLPNPGPLITYEVERYIGNLTATISLLRLLAPFSYSPLFSGDRFCEVAQVECDPPALASLVLRL